MLTRSRVPADLLQLEITETTLMLEPERAVATLHALHALGVTLSVDDYGTGFSSLSYLRDLPVQELKIDRTFITKLTEHSRDSAIVRSTVDLAHSLGIEVVAEGVENGDVMTLVRSFGCDLAQGYHICKPKPANELTAWLRTQPTQTDDTLFASITCADSSHALSPCSVLPAQPSVDDASPTLARS